MNFAYQYLPSFVDGDPVEVEFTTQEELLALEWVNRWTKGDKFIRFTLQKLVNQNDDRNFVLSAELKHTPLAHGDKPWRDCWIAFVRSDEGLTFEGPK